MWNKVKHLLGNTRDYALQADGADRPTRQDLIKLWSASNNLQFLLEEMLGWDHKALDPLLSQLLGNEIPGKWVETFDLNLVFNPNNRRKLTQGLKAEAATAPLATPENSAQYRSILIEGMSALQSLDNLGEDLNRCAWKILNTLQNRWKATEKSAPPKYDDDVPF